jgi:hypothetical protein
MLPETGGLAMYFQDLDHVVRARMIEEIRFDIERNSLYERTRMNQAWVAKWPDALT